MPEIRESAASFTFASRATVRISRQSPVPALCSALIPGLGQYLLGEARKAWFFLVLGLLGLLLFLPPFRVPKTYTGFMLMLLYGFVLTITAACQALRSRAMNRSPGSYWWLPVLIPLALIATSVGWAHFIRVGGLHVYSVPSTSMENTILQGDHLMADLRAYRHTKPSRGEVVMVERPVTPGLIIVKRVIATGGDTIQGVQGRVYRNGALLNEPYVQHTGAPSSDLTDFGPVSIPAEKFFVMGDNRDMSLDSRSPEFGLVDASAIIGKPLFISKAAHDRSGEVVR